MVPLSIITGILATSSATSFTVAAKRGYLSLPEEPHTREVTVFHVIVTTAALVCRVHTYFCSIIELMIFDVILYVGMYLAVRHSNGEHPTLNANRFNVGKGVLLGFGDITAKLSLIGIFAILSLCLSKTTETDDLDIKAGQDAVSYDNKGFCPIEAYERCVRAPITEEFTFRGTWQPWLQNYMSQKAALLVTSIIFGAIHYLGTGSLIQVFSATFGGLIYGAVRESSNSMIAPIAGHIINNSCVTLINYRLSALSKD